MQPPAIEPQHLWLQKLVGDWNFRSDANMGPDQPPMQCGGSESVRSLGDLWILGEGSMEMPGGAPGGTLLTLGYDPVRKRFVGSWVGSMMTHMWRYEGSLDASGRVLTLDTEGPSFTDPNKTSRYHDIIEVKSEDLRTLTSEVQMPDGTWFRFMRAEYRRVK